MRNLEHDVVAFADRRGRYAFIDRRFPGLLDDAKSILDVGCDDNYLKQKYGAKVFGVDIGGTPDRKVNLEQEGLRFIPDASYELVICTEVLEHLDNLHEVFDELLRVSSKYVLISLPNTSSSQRLWRIIKTGTNGKFYGLPFKKPEDRHKWFMSYKEIISFMENAAEEKNLTIKRFMLHHNVVYGDVKNPFTKIKQALLASVIRLFNWKNYAQDVFVLFEKNENHSKV